MTSLALYQDRETECSLLTTVNTNITTELYFLSRRCVSSSQFVFIWLYMARSLARSHTLLSTHWNNGTIIHGYVNYLQFWHVTSSCVVLLLYLLYCQSMNDPSLSFAFSVGSGWKWSLHCRVWIQQDNFSQVINTSNWRGLSSESYTLQFTPYCFLLLMS